MRVAACIIGAFSKAKESCMLSSAPYTTLMERAGLDINRTLHRVEDVHSNSMMLAGEASVAHLLQ